MTLPRKLILEDIAATVRLKREHYQKGNEEFSRIQCFARSTAKYFEDEQRKKEAIQECDELEAKYQLCWEVIWITMCHNDRYLINQHCNGG